MSAAAEKAGTRMERDTAAWRLVSHGTSQRLRMRYVILWHMAWHGGGDSGRAGDGRGGGAMRGTVAIRDEADLGRREGDTSTHLYSND